MITTEAIVEERREVAAERLQYHQGKIAEAITSPFTQAGWMSTHVNRLGGRR
jgi:hypothetical protein